MDENLTPRERRALRTREAILDAARQIISKEGVDALSIRGIADAIDYSPAGLYEYFGSKEEIIMAVVNQGFDRFTQALGGVDVALPPTEYLRQVGLAYIDFAVHNPDFFLLMFTTAPLSDFYKEGRKEICDATSAVALLKDDPSFGILYRAVKRCADEGSFQADTEEAIFGFALTAWSHIHGVAMLRVTYFRNIPADLTQLDNMGLDMLFSGLTAKREMDSDTQ